MLLCPTSGLYFMRNPRRDANHAKAPKPCVRASSRYGPLSCHPNPALYLRKP